MNFLFDAAAQMPEVNEGIEAGMKLSESGRNIAMKRNEAELKIAADEMASRDRLNMRPETQDIRTAGIVTPGWLSGATPSGPNATQVAAAAPAPAAVAPPDMIPAPAGGYGPIIPEAGLSGPLVSPSLYERGMVGPRAAADVATGPIRAGLDFLGQSANAVRSAGVWAGIADPNKPMPYGGGWGVSEPYSAPSRIYAKALEEGRVVPEAADVNAGKPDAVNRIAQYIVDKNTGFATPDEAAAKKAKAPADNTPAAQALADTQAATGLAVPGTPLKGAPVGALTTAGLAAPGSPSAAVAAEGATNFNMELRRAMSQRDVIINAAQRNYNIFMRKAQEADIMANAQLRVSNPQGAKTYRDEADLARQNAISTQTDMVGKVGQFDAAIQTNILGFATDRLNAYGDTETISKVFSQQADQPIAIRPSGTLGADGKPTYNMWLQGKSGEWTAVSDAKSGKATPMSAIDIAQRAQISVSSGYRGQLATAAHEAQLKDAESRRKIVEKTYENVAERNKAIDVWKATEGAGYKFAPNQSDTNGMTFVSHDGKLMRFVVPPVDKSAPAVPAPVQYYGRSQ